MNSRGIARSHSFSLRGNYTKNEKKQKFYSRVFKKGVGFKACSLLLVWAALGGLLFTCGIWWRWLHIGPLTDHKGTWLPPRSFWEHSLGGRPVPCHEDTQASRWGGACVRNGSHVRHHLGSGPSSPCRTFRWRGPGQHLDCSLSGDSEPHTKPLQIPHPPTLRR